MRLLVLRRPSKVNIKGRATIIIKRDNKIVERPIRDIDAVLVIGDSVDISSSVPPVLNNYNIPLSVLAKNTISIMFNPVQIRFNLYRQKQYCLEKGEALTIAKEYIYAKLQGMNNILRYYGETPVQIPDLEPGDRTNLEERIRLWESIYSSALWKKVMHILRPDIVEVLHNKYHVNGRRPGHPDPFNNTLSVMYGVLYSLATKALLAAGLDPTYGFLHRTRYSTPLTFDYTEMYKPVAIQATINLLNSRGLPHLDTDGEIAPSDITKIISHLYNYLVLRHRKTRKSVYQYIFIKAYCLAKHLDRKCPKQKLTIVWDKRNYYS